MKLIKCVNKLTQTSLFTPQKTRSQNLGFFSSSSSLPVLLCLSIHLPTGDQSQGHLQAKYTALQLSYMTRHHFFFPFPPSSVTTRTSRPPQFPGSIWGSQDRELLKDQRTLEILMIINVGGKAGATGCECIQGQTIRPSE